MYVCPQASLSGAWLWDLAGHCCVCVCVCVKSGTVVMADEFMIEWLNGSSSYTPILQ